MVLKRWMHRSFLNLGFIDSDFFNCRVKNGIFYPMCILLSKKKNLFMQVSSKLESFDVDE